MQTIFETIDSLVNQHHIVVQTILYAVDYLLVKLIMADYYNFLLFYLNFIEKHNEIKRDQNGKFERLGVRVSEYCSKLFKFFKN